MLSLCRSLRYSRVLMTSRTWIAGSTPLGSGPCAFSTSSAFALFSVCLSASLVRHTSLPRIVIEAPMNTCRRILRASIPIPPPTLLHRGIEPHRSQRRAFLVPPCPPLDLVILFAGQFQDESSGWETFARLGPGNQMLGAKMPGAWGLGLRASTSSSSKSVR